MSDFELKRNDVSPAIEYQLKDDGGNAVDITGFNEVKFFMRKQGKITNKVEGNTAGNVSVTDAANGKVKYEWQAADTDTAGVFDAEWEVEFNDGNIETFPNTGYIEVKIREDLG